MFLRRPKSYRKKKTPFKNKKSKVSSEKEELKSSVTQILESNKFDSTDFEFLYDGCDFKESDSKDFNSLFHGYDFKTPETNDSIPRNLDELTMSSLILENLKCISCQKYSLIPLVSTTNYKYPTKYYHSQTHEVVTLMGDEDYLPCRCVYCKLIYFRTFSSKPQVFMTRKLKTTGALSSSLMILPEWGIFYPKDYDRNYTCETISIIIDNKAILEINFN